MDEYDDYDGIFCDDEIVDYLLISEAIDDNSGLFTPNRTIIYIGSI